LDGGSGTKVGFGSGNKAVFGAPWYLTVIRLKAMPGAEIHRVHSVTLARSGAEMRLFKVVRIGLAPDAK
jgi:hypothetical protein